MPQEEKQYMRIDVCNKESVAKRYKQIEIGKTIRLIGECKGKIIGEAGLETMRYGWLRRSGEVRLLVLPEYQELGMEKILAREIFLLAARLGLNNLITRVMETQTRTFEIFKSLGFQHEATQKAHVVDMQGEMHDVFLMTFSLRKMWLAMEEAIWESSESPLD